jgi:hypothetical protein
VLRGHRGAADAPGSQRLLLRLADKFRLDDAIAPHEGALNVAHVPHRRHGSRIRPLAKQRRPACFEAKPVDRTLEAAFRTEAGGRIAKSQEAGNLGIDGVNGRSGRDARGLACGFRSKPPPIPE